MSDSEQQELPTTLHEVIDTSPTGITLSQSKVEEPLAPPAPNVDYKFKEDLYLKELLTYISSTYGQHYSLSKIQSTEFIMDAGHGLGFTIGNIIKYAQRYGKKAGHNRADLLKVCHYAIMSLYVHDHFIKE